MQVFGAIRFSLLSLILVHHFGWATDFQEFYRQNEAELNKRFDLIRAAEFSTEAGERLTSFDECADLYGALKDKSQDPWKNFKLKSKRTLCPGTRVPFGDFKSARMTERTGTSAGGVPYDLILVGIYADPRNNSQTTETLFIDTLQGMVVERQWEFSDREFNQSWRISKLQFVDASGSLFSKKVERDKFYGIGASPSVDLEFRSKDGYESAVELTLGKSKQVLFSRTDLKKVVEDGHEYAIPVKETEVSFRMKGDKQACFAGRNYRWDTSDSEYFPGSEKYWKCSSRIMEETWFD